VNYWGKPVINAGFQALCSESTSLDGAQEAKLGVIVAIAWICPEHCCLGIGHCIPVKKQGPLGSLCSWAMFLVTPITSFSSPLPVAYISSARKHDSIKDDSEVSVRSSSLTFPVSSLKLCLLTSGVVWYDRELLLSLEGAVVLWAFRSRSSFLGLASGVSFGAGGMSRVVRAPA
jgi:hypothetical protein